MTTIHKQSAVLPVLGHGYTSDKPDAVRAFLQQHPEVVTFLTEAPPHLRRYFPDSPLCLDVIIDPDGSGAPEIQLTIVPTGAPEDAIAGFEQFTAEWWGEQFVQLQGKVGVLLEYR
ncbi:MAG: hypothetical protein M3Z04_19890 [Chloroflexota bacterium]|nr:hypothetical protein [Chloroflexota bacterium]